MVQCDLHLGQSPETGRMGAERYIHALLVRADEDHGAQSRTGDSKAQVCPQTCPGSSSKMALLYIMQAQTGIRDDCQTHFLMHTLPLSSRRLCPIKIFF